MIARTVGSGWQTILADLSLILFMVTASALANTPDGPFGSDADAPAAPRPPIPPPPIPQPPPIMPVARAEPVGVWRATAGAPSLPQWLGEVARDPRLRLTITVHYAPGGRDAAMAEAARLDRTAGVHGETGRIVIEPGQPAGASAVIGYDADAGSGTQLAGHGA
jgi:hypothetical protein